MSFKGFLKKPQGHMTLSTEVAKDPKSAWTLHLSQRWWTEDLLETCWRRDSLAGLIFKELTMAPAGLYLAVYLFACYSD